MGQARYDREMVCEGTDSMITHRLEGMGQARYGPETAVRARIRRSLTIYMGWDKHDAVLRWPTMHGFDAHSQPTWNGTSAMVRQLTKHGFDDHSLITHKLDGMGQARRV